MSTPHDHHHDHDDAAGDDGDADAIDGRWDARLDRLERGLPGLRSLVRIAGSPDAWQAAPDDGALDRLSRRALFKLAGAGIAAAGLAACSSRPSREILPYANQPPEVTPGVPLHYATALVEDGFATGVLVASHEGRPTKIEGNPDHPASLGATRAIEQAAVLALYDPQRARGVTDRGVPAAWSAVEKLLAAAALERGRGLAIVLEPTSSLYLVELLQRVRTALPEATIAFWSPFSPRASLAGNRLAFGRALETRLDLRTAEVIVALDADLVAGHPMALAYARQISDRRRVVDGSSAMARLYAIETSYTATGVIADHRVRARPSDIERIAIELLAAVIAAMPAADRVPAALHAALAGKPADAERVPAIDAIARDLVRAAGRSVVAAGERQSPVVHLIAAAINELLGNTGRTVAYAEPAVFEAGQPSHDLVALVRAIERSEVRSLLVLGGNPVYTAPADLQLAGAFSRVPSSLYLGVYDNETALACRFLVPALHDLESWDVVRAHDGTVTPQQPLIEPLFGGRSPGELLHGLLGDAPATARERVHAAWIRQLPGADFDDALALGVVANTAHPPVAVELAWNAIAPALPVPPPRARFELELRPHPIVHDGRYTNNPWLLELPEPTTKLTWDNAAMMSPSTAAAIGIETGDIVALAVAGHGEPIDLPAVIVPGHADGAITVHAGYGRDGSERIARGIGASAFRLWTTAGGFHPEVIATPRGRHRDLAITQVHWQLEQRPIYFSGTLARLRDDAEFRAELAGHRAPRPSLMHDFPAGGAQWAMSIDLTTCTGCSACVMACAVENNTPVVGARDVRNKREMHWLRIDRYYVGRADAPTVVVQPMTCQHCEKAPCEYVCPVYATTHSPDGINEMTYNRCIGTRFCSNNCPYKVRRFNWLDWKDRSLTRLARNPDVTVRDRGVMEKCTYCVQRIRRAEIDARIANRPIGRDEVRTACQQVCPAQAITFGSITDPRSTVAEQRNRPHSFAVLDDQGTVPRTRYLARIRNPNGALR